jgi:transposase
MKTQLQQPAAGKAKYSAEYKQQALEHWKNSGRSAATVAAELGIRAPLLYRWARQLRVDAQQGGQPERKTTPSVDLLQAEIRRLKEENAKLLEQREVLKKSLGILSEPPPRGMPKLQP